jgi:hypothetical protein
MKAVSDLRDEEYLGKHAVEFAELIETKIGHELNLINHRISWLATSQSFLMLAVAALLATRETRFHPAVLGFAFSIPIVGLVLCIQVLRSVRAAFRVLTEHLLPERRSLTNELNRLSGLSMEPLGPDRLTDFVGALPAKWIPATFMVSWLVVLGLLVWLVLAPFPPD